MFFAASKILAFVAVPSNLLILLAVLGALLLGTRFARAGRGLLAGALALIVVIGLTPVGMALVGCLEDRFPPWDASRGAPAGFIVLGGGLDADLTQARGTPMLDGGAERITVLADLARRYPAARFVYSGGNGRLFGGAAEADEVLALLETFGVPRARVVLEPRSRNTAENAEFSKALIGPKAGERWVVITSAMHMARAIGAFRAVGFDVEAYPVDWRTPGKGWAVDFPASFVAGLANLDAAAREIVGLAMYRLAGCSSELLPAPR